MEEKINLNEIVKIEQMPVVFEQLEKIGALIEEKTKDLDKLECTEENKQEVKQRRTDINNVLKLLEDKRKEIKNKLLEPYNTFNEKYEVECKERLENASELLKTKIDYIEDYQLAIKENELRDFAKEHFIDNNLENIVKFDDIKLNITLPASMKSLKEQIIGFTEKVSKDIELINLEEYKEEIMVEYQKTLDFAESKLKVSERHRLIEEMKNVSNKIEQKQIEEEKQTEKVEEAIEITVPKEIIPDEEIIKVSFTIETTKSNIVELKNWLKERNISYE